jgi:drug/metabolite transporter (DMT)-like permease
MTEEFVGKLFRICGAAATVGLGACVHVAAETVPLGQIMALRAGISMVLILVYGVLAVPVRTLLPVRYHPHLIRGALACVGMALTFTAYARLPVTQAQTLVYLAPVLIVPFAMWRLAERITWHNAVSLALGFSGVLMILGLTFDAGRAAFVGALAGVGAAVIIAVIQVKIREMTATESAISIALSFTVIVFGVASLSALGGGWVRPVGAAFWALAGAGVFGAASARRACRGGGIGEDVQPGQVAVLDQPQRVLEHRLGLGREARDDVGAEGHVGPQRARLAEADRVVAQVPPLHPLQDQVVAVLQRQVQMRHQARLVAMACIRFSSASIESMEEIRRRGRSGHQLQDAHHQIAQPRLPGRSPPQLVRSTPVSTTSL